MNETGFQDQLRRLRQVQAGHDQRTRASGLIGRVCGPDARYRETLFAIAERRVIRRGPAGTARTAGRLLYLHEAFRGPHQAGGTFYLIGINQADGLPAAGAQHGGNAAADDISLAAALTDELRDDPLLPGLHPDGHHIVEPGSTVGAVPVDIAAYEQDEAGL